jgi:hypothetical protein
MKQEESLLLGSVSQGGQIVRPYYAWLTAVQRLNDKADFTHRGEGDLSRATQLLISSYQLCRPKASSGPSSLLVGASSLLLLAAT